MKKFTSTLSLIVLVVLAIWQYFTDSTKTKNQLPSPTIEQAKQTKASEPKFETNRTDIEKSAVKNPIKRQSGLGKLLSINNSA